MSRLSNRNALIDNLADVMALTVTEFGLAVARCLLAATFLIAGTAKLTNRRASIQALRDFGIPRFAQPLMPLLAPLEIAVGAGFLFAASAWYAAWAGSGLLAIFIAGIAANLARGQQPPCNCFGQLHVKPISWRTLARNGVLAACAAWIVASGPPQPAADLWAVLSRLDSHARRVALVFAAVIGVAMLHVLRQEDESSSEPWFDDEPEPSVPQYRAAAIRTAPAGTAAASFPGSSQTPDDLPETPSRVLTGDGLAIGSSAPAFTLPDLDGQPHSLDSLRSEGKPLVLIFSSPYCESCRALAPKLPSLAAVHQQALRMVLISRGSAQQNRIELKKAPDPLLVLLQRELEVVEAYDCTATPAAVVIDADGIIRTQLAVGAPAIAQLISSYSKP